jgi:hypothetical protein
MAIFDQITHSRSDPFDCFLLRWIVNEHAARILSQQGVREVDWDETKQHHNIEMK